MRKTINRSINLIGVFFCFFLLFFLSFQSTAYPVALSYYDTVQKIYIGYYQRAADPGGLLYWADRLDESGGNLTETIEAFASAAESNELYGSINSSNISNVVNGIYYALFGRDAEAEGLNYYVTGFNSGLFTPATIMLNVLSGAQNDDLRSLNNKLAASNQFTRIIDPELNGRRVATYEGSSDSIAARNYLASVTSNLSSLPTQIQATEYIKTNIANPGDAIYSIDPVRQLYFFSQGSAGFYYNSPTLVDNYIYIGTSRGFSSNLASDNYFFKLNLNLTKVWEYPLGNIQVKGGATLDSAGNIYFVIQEGRLPEDTSKSKLYLYSLDKDGVFRWYKLINSVVLSVGMSNPAIAVDDTIYVGGDKFYAFDANGNQKWTYGNNMIIMNSPVIDPNGNIYFNIHGSRDGKSIVSLDKNGGERWAVSAFGEAFSSPAFSTDYSKIFVGIENKLYCLQTSTGIKVWEFTPPGIVGWFRATPAVDNYNNVYIGTKGDSNSIFYAVKSDGSGLLWKNAIGADLYSSPTLGDDNTLYVGSEVSEGKGLHALDMATGNTKWSSDFIPYHSSPIWSSPVLTNTGYLYVATMDGINLDGSIVTGGVYAFRTESTGLLKNAGSARFHGGNSNTGRRE